MDRKKELKQQFKEIEVEAGIYQIKNTKNGKIFVESLRNLKSLNGIKFMLRMGTHTNKELQNEWATFGGECFEFEVLELVNKKKFKETSSIKRELEKLLDKWLDELKPYGEDGYNGNKE